MLNKSNTLADVGADRSLSQNWDSSMETMVVQYGEKGIEMVRNGISCWDLWRFISGIAKSYHGIFEEAWNSPYGDAIRARKERVANKVEEQI